MLPASSLLGFAGGAHDQDTGLIRFGVRDFDPAAARWFASDPIRFSGADANLFAYTDEDPVNRIDPSGLYGTNDCTYYDQMCATTHQFYYCYEALSVCRAAPKPPKPGSSYEGFARCTRQCLPGLRLDEAERQCLREPRGIGNAPVYSRDSL